MYSYGLKDALQKHRVNDDAHIRMIEWHNKREIFIRRPVSVPAVGLNTKDEAAPRHWCLSLMARAARNAAHFAI